MPLALRRVTSHGNWIPEIDGLRFVANVATLLAHILGETFARSGQNFSPVVRTVVYQAMDRGGRGVQLFFAISGFILAQPFLRQHLLQGTKVSVKAFYKRRLTRLEPPYILSLLIYAAALGLRGGFHSLLPSLLTSVLYIHNWTNLGWINFVAWSLEVEVQFYILAPLLGLLYAIRSAVLRRGIMVGFILASMSIHMLAQKKMSWNLPGQLQFFMVGFLLADLRARRTESTIKPWWDALNIAAWAMIFLLPVKLSYLTLPALILIAYLGVFNGPIARKIFSTPWIAVTGGMCYSFYLMHMLVISIAFRWSKYLMVPNFGLSYLIQTVVLGVCIYTFCTAYYVLIERPCMNPNWVGDLSMDIRRRLWFFQVPEGGDLDTSPES
jgi:peptidoglycan/LPS O-acetylase OafA/YrhL